MGVLEMSMINQMLKDLDSRQGKTSDAQPMLTDVRLSPSPGRKLIKPIGLTLLAIAIGIGLFARFRQVQTTGPVVGTVVVVPGVGMVPVQPGPAVDAPSAAIKPADVPEQATPNPVPGGGAATLGAASPTPTGPKATADGAGEASPEQALQRWFSAYSAGNSATYFKMYAANFVPPNGVSYAAWKEQRSNFFARGKKAKIEMTDVRIETKGAEAQSHFHQRFRSPGYNDDVEKTLSWRQVNGKWLVVAEISRPLPPATSSPSVKDTGASDTQASELPNKSAQKSSGSRTASIKSVNPKQLSANLYRDAVTMIQEGHLTDAQGKLALALDANASNHGARQMLADLLVDAGRRREAAVLLSTGLSLAPGHSGFCIALARLHLASGAKQEALAILQQGLSNAGDDGEYNGFFAALLQTFGRHEEATKHYLIALRSDPSMPTWLVGIGISLRTQKKSVDAAEAFQRALDTGELSVEVADFARQQIDQLRRSR